MKPILKLNSHRFIDWLFSNSLQEELIQNIETELSEKGTIVLSIFDYLNNIDCIPIRCFDTTEAEDDRLRDEADGDWLEDWSKYDIVINYNK